MKAAVLWRFNALLDITDVEQPRPGADEAVVRVRATGTCGTDLKVISGAFDHIRLPLVPGHEIAGELVDDVGELRRGQRVACYLYDPCGECRYCKAGRQTLCPNSRRLGYERDGGFAEYVAVGTQNLLPFGDDLPFEVAAVTMDAVLSPWHALLDRGQLQAGESLAIVGAGGLGLNAVQIAVSRGARVAVIEPNPDRRDVALAFGAELAVAPGAEAAVTDWADDGGVDLAYEAVGVRSAFDTASAVLRPGGRLICCGYRPGVEYGLDSSRLVLDEITVLGSRAGNREDARAALGAVEAKQVTPLIGLRLELDEANEAIAQLRSGDVAGRIVILQ